MYNILLKSDFLFILLYLKKNSLTMHDFRTARVVLPPKIIHFFRIIFLLSGFLILQMEETIP